MFYKKILYILLALYLSNCSSKTQKNITSNLLDFNKNSTDTNSTQKKEMNKTPKTQEEWKAKLTPEEYYVLREKGTERPFSGEFENHHEKGIYVCKGCGTELFRSETKFDAHCGWPSFYEGIDKSNIKEIVDRSHGMIRTEVTCAKCGGHLGHVFNDGPTETGKRYCINSVCLDLKPKK